MSQSLLQAPVHRFDGWEMRPLERALLVRGEAVRVGSRAFDLLLALLERRDRVVEKSELLDLVWKGRVVEENNLSVQITALRRLLGEQVIANVSGVGYRFVARPLDDATPAQPGPAPASRMPAASSVLGRAADLAALRPQLALAPLLTLVGTGGVGKTTLARALVAQAAPALRDGIHWIDLAPVRPGNPLLPLVAESLGVLAAGQGRELGSLALAGMQALVVLDNCEHLVAEVAQLLSPLLRDAPGLRWLATSQEALRLGGETVYRLQPLQVPSPDASLDEALASGALALLYERVRAVDRSFELGPDRLHAAVELCRQLDGLPLALEMAAARVATLGLQGVHDQIDQRLRLRAGTRDAPGRHHTLLQTFEWSCGLLSELERRLFARLEPFLGGFEATMAEQLYLAVTPGEAEPWQVREALSALVDKSLVQPAGAAAAGRLRLLESARDYARLLLRNDGAHDGVRTAHAEVVAQAFAQAHGHLQQLRDDEWGARYMPERRNVCAALGWACTLQRPELLARLVAALAQLDIFAWAQAEVVQYAIPVDVLHGAPLPLRARAYLELGWAHFQDGNRETGTDLALRALADFESLGDQAGIFETLAKLVRLYEGRPGMGAQARQTCARLQSMDADAVPLRERLHALGMIALRTGGEDAVARLQELHRVAKHAGFDALASAFWTNISNQLLVQGQFEEAAAMGEDRIGGEAKHLRTHAMLCHNTALALMRLGRVDEARVAARAALRALPSAAHMVIDTFALAALQSGRAMEAALMAGWSARFNRERHRHSDAAEAAVIADTLQGLDAQLGRARREALMSQGADMPASAVLALALPA